MVKSNSKKESKVDDYKLTLVLTVTISILMITMFVISQSNLSGMTGFAVSDGNLPEKLSNDVYDAVMDNGTARVIVELKNSGTQEEVISSLDVADNEITPSDDIKINREFDSSNSIAGEVTEQGLAKLASNSDVEAIYLDRILTIELADSVPLINATAAWSRQVSGVNITGRGQSVCIIDTGVNADHPALVDRVIAERCYCSVSGSQGCCPNRRTTDNDAMDDNNHGTHVAGIIASNDAVYRGVAPEGNIVAVKACNATGSCSSSDIIAAIEWCTSNVNLYNISAISISLGGGGYDAYCDSLSDTMTTAINNAVGAGIIVVASSGNNGYTDRIAWPACISNVTAVGATDKNDVIASYSNRNSLVDLIAPGGSSGNAITSSFITGFGAKYGTSMAVPHVSGAILLLKQYMKKYNAGNELTAKEIETLMKISGKQISSGSNTFSRIDISNSINTVLKRGTNSVENSAGKVQFDSSTNLEDAESAFTISENSISLNSMVWPKFNKPATLTLSGLSFAKQPVVLKDGEVCQTCSAISYSNNTFVFSVAGFSAYSAGVNSQLSTSDSSNGLENAFFHADYTAKADNSSIDGTCTINFSDASGEMTLNAGRFEYNRTFAAEGTYEYSILCSDENFETLNISDSIIIAKTAAQILIQINGIEGNASASINSQVEINVSLTQPVTGNLKLYLNEVLASEGTSPVSILSSFNSTGMINVTATYDETSNYLASSQIFWINVSEVDEVPVWSNISNSPSSASWNENVNYQFNITWTDNSLSSVIIEHNFNGSNANYTVATNNNGEYYYNWSNLAAGIYSITWHAIDAAGQTNSTSFNYEVAKKQSILVLKLNDAEAPLSLSASNSSYANVNATLTLPLSGTVTVKKDSAVLFSGEKNVSASVACNIGGNFYINASYPGTANYSAVEKVYLVTVSAGSTSSSTTTTPTTTPTTSPSTSTGAAGGAPSSSGCVEKWVCSDWSECVNGEHTRTCSDANACGTAFDSPFVKEACVPCTEEWKCSEWGECLNGSQTRTCSDANACGTEKSKPADLTQACNSTNAGIAEALNFKGMRGITGRIVEETKKASSNSFGFVKETTGKAYDKIKSKPFLIIPPVLIVGLIAGGIVFFKKRKSSKLNKK